ncbi:hypothetical protein N658DRAFT_245286 [Parathielavia hyrcaniae]|uniref:Uncharacterized protein n=1 Tax=Parathielavia hyrcaniae TaxID=113614 RepID=A0AAN6T3W6_9PEZI|nr:hypothetical protein N658DRAFT_245286 [Parathielavia hyrcaniae]
MYTTKTHTLTSCPPSVTTGCPGRETTTVIPIGTTICPVGDGDVTTTTTLRTSFSQTTTVTVSPLPPSSSSSSSSSSIVEDDEPSTTMLVSSVVATTPSFSPSPSLRRWLARGWRWWLVRLLGWCCDACEVGWLRGVGLFLECCGWSFINIVCFLFVFYWFVGVI